MPARIKLHVKVLSPPGRASVDEMLNRAVGFFAMNGPDQAVDYRLAFDLAPMGLLLA